VRLAILAALLALTVTAAAPARSNDDERHLALVTLQKNVTEARKAEKYAFIYNKSGSVDVAAKELRAAAVVIKDTEQVASYLTTYKWLDGIHGNPWDDVRSEIDYILADDQKAASPDTSVARRRQLLLNAGEKKNDLIDLVTNELEHAPCTEVVDLRGPITVSGVPQGHSTVTVDVSCDKPEKSIYVDIPAVVITGADTGGTGTEQIEKGGKVVEVDLHGGTSGEVTIQSSPDPAAGEKIDVVVIAGDSVDYIPEVM
jgi:hypothetical protein